MLIFFLVWMAFFAGYLLHKNRQLVKQMQSMTFMYDMITNMYTVLAETVMMHEGIDITPYIEGLNVVGGVRNGKHL